MILSYSIPILSQTGSSQKHEFVYKVVQGHEIKANIFLPKTKAKHPVVVFYHGGFFFGNRDQGVNNALKDKLVSSGYAVVSADYRLAPETKLKGILEDVRDIIIWLRKDGVKNFNIDIDKITASGCSAGGYLALTTGFNPKDAPNVIIAVSPPTGFSTAITPMGDPTVLFLPGPYDVVKNSIISYGDYDSRIKLWRFLRKNRLAHYELFGFDPATEPEKLEGFTLTHNVKSTFPPTFLIQARHDPLVDLKQVEDFYKFLENKKIKTQIYLVENGHGNKVIDQNPEVIDKIILFLNNQFKR